MRKFIALLVGALVALMLTVSASADMGPKPQLFITVKNPPQELYYLDLLVQSENIPGVINMTEPATLDEEMKQKLYSVEGWTPMLADGGYLMFGSLTGDDDGEGNMLHKFSYIGVPDSFRVIIVTSSGEIKVSDVQERTMFASYGTYDYAKNTYREQTGALVFIAQLLSTLLPTLVIEGVLLWLFRYKLRENAAAFVGVNVATQIMLAAVIYWANVTAGVLFAILLYVFAELIILIAEALLYRRLLRGHTPARAAAYGVTANLISSTIGFVSWLWSYQLLY